MLGARPDEMQIVLAEDFGEARILGEKAIAGMHGIGAGDFAGGEQRRDVEITVLGGGRPDADALIGQAHMHGVFIRRGVHRDGGNAELLASPQYPQRDLSAVGDQNLVEHRSGSRARMANGE